jgi:tRNA dimethylallyltransferase
MDDSRKHELQPPKMLVIVGETASGKSALAHRLALQFDGEIICADSWSVYCDFDIGTAKPSPEEQREVRYHLLDVADPVEGFSAAVFQRLAYAAIEDIARRGKLPIVVGGTGLYVDSVLFGYEFLPAPAPELRDRLNSLSLVELLDEAERLGLNTTDIDTRNKRRVIRLIENNGRLPGKRPMRENTLVLGLQLPAEELRGRMAKRVEAMLAAGLEAEVRRLSERYGWEAEPMKGISYREWRDYFSGAQTLDTTKQQIIKDTVDLAKRQRTWFKRNKSINYLCNFEEAVELTTTFLNKS